MPDRTVSWWLPTSGKRWPEDYERGRPGWPPEVVGIADPAIDGDRSRPSSRHRQAHAPAHPRVWPCDRGRAAGCDAECARCALPPAEVLAGTAEQIPLADASVGAVFVAEAFHQLGNEHSVAEIARVLRAGGILVLMWNLPAGPWKPSIAAAERLLQGRLPKTQEFGYDPLDLNPRRYASGEWRQAFAGSHFDDFKEERLPNQQALDKDGLMAYLASMGWIADLPDVGRLPLFEEVQSLLDAGEYRRSWETHVHWTRLSDRQGTEDRRPN